LLELENHILAAILQSRQCYQDLQGTLDPNSLSEHGQLIYKHAAKYYTRDAAATHVDRKLLAASLGTVFPSPKQAEALVEDLHRIPSQVSTANITQLCFELRQYHVGLRLTDAILQRSPDVYSLIREYQELGERGSDLEKLSTKVGFDDIFSSQFAKLPCRPRALCKTLRGGMRPGNNMLVFARPGAGKTLLCTNIAGSYASQGHKVLHIINEEAAQAVALRYLSYMASGLNNDGPTLDQMGAADEGVARKAVALAMERANKAGYQNVHIVYGLTTLPQIRYVIERVEPRVLVLDQVRNISAGGEGLTQNLELVTRELRKFSHEYSLIGIGVSQAGESAEGKALLRLTDLDSSKTGAQGACDLMVGIGVTPELRAEGRRWVCVCRNKISGVIEDFMISVDEQRTKIIEQKPQ
jgi:replicative DNA helicase